MAKKKPLSHTEVSKLGGQTTLKKHGSDHFRKLVQKRWAKHRKAKKIAGGGA